MSWTLRGFNNSSKFGESQCLNYTILYERAWQFACHICCDLRFSWKLECGLLDCKAMYSCRWLQCLGGTYYLTLKMEAICSYKVSVTTYKTTWHCNPEDHNPRLILLFKNANEIKLFHIIIRVSGMNHECTFWSSTLFNSDNLMFARVLLWYSTVETLQDIL
jgi:hypothetical protein